MIKTNRSVLLGFGLAVALICFTAPSAQADSFNFAVHFDAPPPQPAPVVRVEVRPAPPTAQHVWIDGHWGFDNKTDGWVWHHGYWEVPPVPWAQWKPAHGRDWHGEYFWVKGHWDY